MKTSNFIKNLISRNEISMRFKTLGITCFIFENI